ncbi:diguanylate cyclase [Marinomonas ushuaiensis DSM 15871]|uniref:Diguanylate cyclase n=1 Tax=Marinomonas ushuaiensis DSM 15871 TaxID=1122207 RepID=X7E6P8_9GAMM|nr:EAL domain-containing protein [Marinomonas ushuaiensis]ETX11744.1 diguanylate cyclase [Marinomonas ushuaiensis DSM 15871]
MIFRNVVFFFLLASLFSTQSAFANEYTQKSSDTFPTFKETTPITAQSLLSLDTFQESLYEESQGFSNSAYWHKLTFPKITTESTDKRLHLGISYYIINNLDFYLFHGDELQQHWARGALQTWNAKDESYKGIWIPIVLSEQKETTLLIRKQGHSPLLTPIMLFNDQEVIDKKEQKLLFWTVILCSLIVLLTHNIFVFMLLRQPGYVYYLGINITILVSLSIITGFNRWIFPEEFSQWTTKNLFFVFGIATWILYKFSLSFLKEVQIPTAESFTRRYGDLGFIAFLIATQLFSEQVSASLFALIEVFMFFFCTYWGVKAYNKGFLAVRFYLFSWLTLMLGSIFNTLIFWKVLPINIMTESILPICSLLQLLGFAFAFADKSNYIERKRQLQAITDPSTGLPNRTYYFEKLPLLISKGAHDQPNLALIMVEITSHLKLSQAFGPAQADIALNDIIKRIHKKTMTMDGFLPLPLTGKHTKHLMRLTIRNIVIVSTTPNELKSQIEQIQQVLDHSILVNKAHFRHQYKIGSALYPSQGSNLDKLYQNALIASNTVTYSSGSWAPFTNKLQSNHAHQLRLITLLTDDIKNEKLYFDIQPQVDLSKNKIVGGEVLLRWHNEYLGQISPAEFIPLAEQTGLIYKLTYMIIEKAFQWAAAHSKELTTHTLSINISALDLWQEDFAKRTSQLIQKYNLNAEQFTIEVTETSIFQNNDIVISNVAQLHQAGFKLAIDDFGVGYSSMQNLVSLQTDELKIDQFFVMNLLNNKQSQTLCRNMINLSEELNITSVAEGIESEEILNLLQMWNCQLGQGYHLHRPMTPASYLNLLDPGLSESSHQ